MYHADLGIDRRHWACWSRMGNAKGNSIYVFVCLYFYPSQFPFVYIYLLKYLYHNFPEHWEITRQLTLSNTTIQNTIKP